MPRLVPDMGMRILCKLCGQVVEHHGQNLVTNCSCGNVGVLWDVFSNPPCPIRVNSFDSRGYEITIIDGAVYDKTLYRVPEVL